MFKVIVRSVAWTIFITLFAKVIDPNVAWWMTLIMGVCGGVVMGTFDD